MQPAGQPTPPSFSLNLFVPPSPIFSSNLLLASLSISQASMAQGVLLHAIAMLEAFRAHLAVVGRLCGASGMMEELL